MDHDCLNLASCGLAACRVMGQNLIEARLMGDALSLEWVLRQGN
jgi:hypothetical protein